MPWPKKKIKSEKSRHMAALCHSSWRCSKSLEIDDSFGMLDFCHAARVLRPSHLPHPAFFLLPPFPYSLCLSPFLPCWPSPLSSVSQSPPYFFHYSLLAWPFGRENTAPQPVTATSSILPFHRSNASHCCSNDA